MELFKPEWGVDNSEIDNTQITNTMLYMSFEEMAEFKKLCKAGMKIEFPETYKDSNLTELLLKVLRDKYAGL